MSLSLYNKKRDFKKTEEPEGKEQTSKGSLRFVVQKHDASHVHYDFRLEMEGVLKSWAVPKGPSLNPSDKRLAMMVEDHPFAYRNFEGVIPAGEYGGGTVIVWDEGTYELAGAENLSRKEQENVLLQALHKGRISFVLHGKKLKGEFTLMQMRGKGKRTWLLMKKKDGFSSEEDVTQNERSAKSGKTLAEVAAENGVELNHPEVKKTEAKGKNKAKDEQPSQKKKDFRVITPSTNHKLQTTNGLKASMPQNVVPMLATLINEPFDDNNWIFEIKWDGYRAVAYCNGKDVSLVSRNLKPFTEKYAPVAKALKELKIKAVLDGEIIAVDEKGLANFQLLQNWQNTPSRLQYFVFDVLWLNGKDVTHLPLIERKALLKELLPAGHEIIKYSDHIIGKGKDFFKVALKGGLEGIMAKKASSVYEIDSRTEDWVKIKVNQRQEVVIAGYTEPRRTRKFFGSLLLGVYDGDDLVYVGHTGSGFNTKTLEAIYNKLQPLKIDHSPFTETPHTNMPATWVKPKLVCEIKFTEWTVDRMARHPIFMGLRTDKKAKDVRFEKATTMAKIKSTAKKASPAKKSVTKKTAAKPRQKRSATKAKTSGKQLNVDGDADQVINLNGQDVQLTNLQKIYWPQEGFRKGDAVNYYLKMAPFILPYLLDRPQSLNRHPNGINAPNFFQKDVRGKVPNWIETVEEFSESTNVHVEYLVCSNEATLIYMANLGCIEINPWHTRKDSMLQPDWCLIDLDPHTGNTFEQVMEVAKVVKKVLDAIGAEACVKTSGSSGIHIYIPLGAKYNYDQSRQLAELIVTLVHNELPELTSLERSPSKRPNKIYLDFLQNSETQTAAAPYSLRPKPGVPVSTPLDWSELKKGLTQKTWNASNIYDRVKSEGDLFKAVLGKGINLEKVLKKVEAIS
ncbi:DNA ligase D [Flavisolibacter ginsenosidimutans]|uniref:DNA ligase (ATP) n=1 Tax=Flavisolibacter ginsenosidimutans TaxID=661481 RepID=A0A5B8UI93_9BACT|nr:DNA ligase D [Flavisolibacter ginsenosidimutans]QEC56086.1 DNA ligase D [Flavisolibacter ginsenosidimutans]